MKPIETAVTGVVFAALCGFFFQLGERSVAAQPPPCPTQPCKTVHCWLYTSTANLAVMAPGTTTPSTHAIPSIYAVSTTETTPTANNGTCDKYSYSNPSYTCAPVKVGGGQTPPTPQELTAGGTATFISNAQTRLKCTYP